MGLLLGRGRYVNVDHSVAPSVGGGHLAALLRLLLFRLNHYRVVDSMVLHLRFFFKLLLLRQNLLLQLALLDILLVHQHLRHHLHLLLMAWLFDLAKIECFLLSIGR